MWVPRNIGPPPSPSAAFADRCPPGPAGPPGPAIAPHSTPLPSTRNQNGARPRAGFADETARQSGWSGSGGRTGLDHGPLSDMPPRRARKSRAKRAVREGLVALRRPLGEESGGNTTVGRDPTGSRPTELSYCSDSAPPTRAAYCESREPSGDDAPHHVVLAPDLVLADPGSRSAASPTCSRRRRRCRRACRTSPSGRRSGRPTFLFALADGLAVLLLRVRLVRQLLADRLPVHVHGVAGAVEALRARRRRTGTARPCASRLGEDLRAAGFVDRDLDRRRWSPAEPAGTGVLGAEPGGDQAACRRRRRCPWQCRCLVRPGLPLAACGGPAGVPSPS